jgi:hypothetical protein
VTQEYLKSILRYDPETGEFVWLEGLSYYAPAGTGAGWLEQGYNNIKIKNKSYRAARLAWLYVYGMWPTKFIDHINGNRGDDRISNLREASAAENNRNRKIRTDSKTKLKGVYFNERSGKYESKIHVNGHSMWLGSFPTAKDAHQAYYEAAQKHFGQFARPG